MALLTTAIDIHNTAGKLADLRRRAEESLHPVNQGVTVFGGSLGEVYG